MFLDAIASPSTYPCQWVSGSVIDSFRLNIAIASPSFASMFLDEASKIFLVVCSLPDGVRGWAYSKWGLISRTAHTSQPPNYPLCYLLLALATCHLPHSSQLENLISSHPTTHCVQTTRCWTQGGEEEGGAGWVMTSTPMEVAAVFKVRKPLFLGLRIDGTIKMLTAYDNKSMSARC